MDGALCSSAACLCQDPNLYIDVSLQHTRLVDAYMRQQQRDMQDMFDQDVAPFQQKYMYLVEEIHNVYGTAKEVMPCLACKLQLLM